MTTKTLRERLADKRSATSTPTVNRRDITVIEEVARESMNTVFYSWVATLDGRLSTGERVELTRSEPTWIDALTSIEAAIAENGWRIS